MSILPIPPSPSERAESLRRIAATASQRTFAYIYSAVETARHSGNLDIFRYAQGQPGHEGARPRVIDVRAHKCMRAALEELMPGPFLFNSEEGAEAYDDLAVTHEVVADPLDGTTNARLIGIGYSSTLAIYERSPDGRRRLRAAGTASHSGAVSWTHRGQSLGDVALENVALALTFESSPGPSTDRLTWVEALVPGDPEAIAVVAAGRKRLALAARLLDPAKTTYGIGGNPLARELLVGGIGSILELSDVALRDAIYLLALENLGGYIADPFTREPINVYEAFNEQNRIGPFVAAASREALGYALGLVHPREQAA